jgi:pimeloyl-ACP methyl ester carboxylesterase
MAISRMIPALVLFAVVPAIGGGVISPPTSQPHDQGFVKVDSSEIHYFIEGEGVVPVVFVSGLGEDLSTWEPVQDSIAHGALTLSYDRAGLGTSGYHGEPKDLTSLSRELHSVVTSTGAGKPAILVGHSLGCQIVKKYASLYPDVVAGILFLDPGYDESLLRAALPDSVWGQRERALKKYLPKFSPAQEQELQNLNAICREADRITRLPDVPIVLMTATLINPDFPGSRQELDVKKETHERWLKGMPAAKHLFVAGSRHYIQNDAPDLVIHELRNMIPAR